MSAGIEVEVEGRRLKLSNLDKVFYPETGFTKGQVIDYYTRIGPVVLPHLRDRPLTMKRYPDGVEGEFFYEKNAPRHTPEWVKRVVVPTEDRDVHFILANDLPTLVWLANLADLELHTSLSKADRLERPTAMTFDLDPGPPAGLLECARVALLLQEALAGLGLQALAKTSGAKGMQLHVPLNTDDVTYEDTKPFAHALAKIMEKQHGELIVSKMRKDLREGKVLIDWSQNDEHKTTVNVYSLRARSRPTVSTPLRWDEVREAVAAEDAGRLRFTSDQVLDRVRSEGDLFAPVIELEQALPSL